MKTETLRRLLVVVGVALVSLWLIFPTIQYFLGVSQTIKMDDQKLAELKAESVPLGLDLQGGVDVLLAIDTTETRFAKVNDVADSIRSQFTSESPAIEGTVEVTSGSETIVVNVARQDQVRAADNTLVQLSQDGTVFDYDQGSLQANEPLQLRVNENQLSQDMAQTVQSTIRTIRDRVDSLGMTQPIVVQQGSDRIRVQIPGESDPQKAISTLIRPAQLEFRAVYSADQPVQWADGKPGYPDASSEIINVATGEPLPGQRIPAGYEVVPHRRDANAGVDAAAQQNFILVRKRPEMTGAGLKDARVQVGQSGAANAGEVEVVAIFNQQGTEDFAEASRKNMYKPLAVMLDGVVYSAPNIRGPITQGYCSITGSFTLQEAQELSLVLKAGALPAQLITKDLRTVEATLGADSIAKSVMALVVGSILVGIFMIAYYGSAGIIAVVAVMLNVVLIFAFMKLANATLTLSGIGGILLTVGMAIDANILIYERIREELRDGKTMKQAIQLGFNRAFSVIFDGNLTTLICGLVLLQFGDGSIKGFALSLNVGIIATLFTGLFVTKTLIDAWYESLDKITFGSFKLFPEGAQLDFLKGRKLLGLLSGGLLLGFIIYLMPFVNGSNWGVDFEGGLLSEVRTTEELNTQDVQGQYSDWRVQKVAGENQFLVRTKQADESTPLAEAQAAVQARLDETIGAGNYTILSSEAVSNEVGQEFTYKAILACLLASVGILIYLGLRFEFVFGFAAVVALLHDVVFAYGLFNILGDLGLAGEVTLDVVAALLVVLGYSVNDSIIVFDRIRENRKAHPGMSDYKLINLSINESLNRTVITLGTAVFVLLAMLIFGGAGLFDFALVLTIGILVGTYSSLYIAAGVVYVLHERARKKGKAITYRESATEQEMQPMLSRK